METYQKLAEHAHTTPVIINEGVMQVAFNIKGHGIPPMDTAVALAVLQNQGMTETRAAESYQFFLIHLTNNVFSKRVDEWAPQGSQLKKAAQKAMKEGNLKKVLIAIKNLGWDVETTTKFFGTRGSPAAIILTNNLREFEDLTGKANQ